MNVAPHEFSRTEERMRWYARTMRHAFFATVALHLVGTLAVNPSLILRLLFPRTLLGYPGASRPGRLAPEGTPGAPGANIFRSRRLAGPSTLIRLDVTADTPGSAPDAPAVNVKSAGESEPVAMSSRTNSAGGGQGSGVRIELDENGAVIAGSGGSEGVVRSQKFQILKLVRPEYPKSAIRAGLDGLVRLQVQVDTTGRVVGVYTEMNTTASRELEEVAIQAMLLWLFKPYQEKNRPVPFTLIVPFRYRLVD
jgi:TonB family protein